jgi:hypothetical protein
MLEHVEKVVAWSPAVNLLKLPNVPGHRTAHRVGEGLYRLEATGSLLELPGLAAAAVRG